MWTLKYEWLFYLSLPLLALFILANKKVPVMLWLLAAMVVWFVVYPYYSDFLKVTTRYLVYFLIGAVGATLAKVDKCKSVAKHPSVTLTAIASIVLAFILFKNEYDLNQVIFLSLFFIPVSLGNSIFSILTHRTLTLLGDMSYSIYVLHGIFLYVAFTLLFPNVMNPGTNVFQFYGMMALSGVALIILTWATYHLIEKPFIGLGRKVSILITNKRNV